MISFIVSVLVGVIVGCAGFQWYMEEFEVCYLIDQEIERARRRK